MKSKVSAIWYYLNLFKTYIELIAIFCKKKELFQLRAVNKIYLMFVFSLFSKFCPIA